MKKYPIKLAGKDFTFVNINSSIKGSRKKKIVIDKDNNKAFFKYQKEGYNVSEACSEKISYEIAKVLGYECATIELAKDYDNTLGVLNYLFIDINKFIHEDAISYLNPNNESRKKFYTITNIKKVLDNLDKSLFKDFIKIMIFDALIGEQDRHEENWGIEKIGNNYKLSPLYDNGCSLLREFKDETFSNNYYSGKKNFNSYIEKSKTVIHKENDGTNYKHFELIEYLNKNYYDIVQKEIKNLSKLTDDIIEKIVQNIPDELLTEKHKIYIIEYLKRRRNIILNIK